MRFITESEIEKRSGTAELTDQEIRDVAWGVSMQSALVVSALVSGQVTGLIKKFRDEVKDRAKKKAMEAWIKDNKAIFDPHRKKWLMLDDNYEDEAPNDELRHGASKGK